MLIKSIIVLLLFYIVFNLFKALFCMIKDDSNSYKMSHFLGRRVMFSAVVLIIVIIASAFGLIELNSNPLMLTSP
jgi:hypothetical protein